MKRKKAEKEKEKAEKQDRRDRRKRNRRQNKTRGRKEKYCLKEMIYTCKSCSATTKPL